MNTLLKIATALVAALALTTSPAKSSEPDDTAKGRAAQVVNKVEQALGRAATATAHGLRRGAEATTRGLERGAAAAAHGIERGAAALGRAAKASADKVQEVVHSARSGSGSN
jgi:hypothetical protein